MCEFVFWFAGRVRYVNVTLNTHMETLKSNFLVTISFPTLDFSGRLDSNSTLAPHLPPQRLCHINPTHLRQISHRLSYDSQYLHLQSHL